MQKLEPQIGFRFRPAAEKIPKWLVTIEGALQKQSLPPGEASKLCGKLAWGGSHLFHRIGRALLRPLYDQCSRYDGKLNPELEHARLTDSVATKRTIMDVVPVSPLLHSS